jgi:hypothetical protein
MAGKPALASVGVTQEPYRNRDCEDSRAHCFCHANYTHVSQSLWRGLGLGHRDVAERRNFPHDSAHFDHLKKEARCIPLCCETTSATGPVTLCGGPAKSARKGWSLAVMSPSPFPLPQKRCIYYSGIASAQSEGPAPNRLEAPTHDRSRRAEHG